MAEVIIIAPYAFCSTGGLECSPRCSHHGGSMVRIKTPHPHFAPAKATTSRFWKTLMKCDRKSRKSITVDIAELPSRQSVKKAIKKLLATPSKETFAVRHDSSYAVATEADDDEDVRFPNSPFNLDAMTIVGDESALFVPGKPCMLSTSTEQRAVSPAVRITDTPSTSPSSINSSLSDSSPTSTNSSLSNDSTSATSTRSSCDGTTTTVANKVGSAIYTCRPRTSRGLPPTFSSTLLSFTPASTTTSIHISELEYESNDDSDGEQDDDEDMAAWCAQVKASSHTDWRALKSVYLSARLFAPRALRAIDEHAVLDLTLPHNTWKFDHDTVESMKMYLQWYRQDKMARKSENAHIAKSLLFSRLS